MYKEIKDGEEENEINDQKEGLNKIIISNIIIKKES